MKLREAKQRYDIVTELLSLLGSLGLLNVSDYKQFIKCFEKEFNIRFFIYCPLTLFTEPPEEDVESAFDTALEEALKECKNKLMTHEN